MKKSIIGLLLLLVTFTYSKSLNTYETKRIFDKWMDVYLNSNYKKYVNDKEMYKILSMDKITVEEAEAFDKVYKEFWKNLKYKVIDVNEMEETSFLTLEVTGDGYNASKEIVYEAQLQAYNEIITEYNVDETFFEDDKLNAEYYKKIKKKLEKYLIREKKIIVVFMYKIDGFWEVDNKNGLNEEFFCSLYSLPYVK